MSQIKGKPQVGKVQLCLYIYIYIERERERERERGRGIGMRDYVILPYLTLY